MANVLRTPKSKERFGDCSVDKPSPFKLSRISSADKEDGEKQGEKQNTYEAFFDVVPRPQPQAFHAGDLSLRRTWLKGDGKLWLGLRHLTDDGELE